ncbi:MAG: HAD family hydrolase [Dokdonella sp.]
MLSTDDIVFLFDVDDTLLDNDRFGSDLGAELEHAFGAGERDRYWSIYAALRDASGYADYLGALQKFRDGIEQSKALLRMSSFLLDYPFADRLYPSALETLNYLRTHGRITILSDGDIVFQPRKIQRSGLWDAVAGEVLITVHKEQSMVAIERRFPACHYVMVDDKPALLAAMKRVLGQRVSTVFVRQGHYARAAIDAADSAHSAVTDPPPDFATDAIGDLRHGPFNEFLATALNLAVVAHKEPA